jgi:transcription elongation GreA/GreB family factor
MAQQPLRSIVEKRPGSDRGDPTRASILERATLSYVSPLARAVLGGRVGDTVEVTGGSATITEIK